MYKSVDGEVFLSMRGLYQSDCPEPWNGKSSKQLELLLAMLHSWSDCDAAVAVEACS